MEHQYADLTLNRTAAKKLFAEKIAHYALCQPRYFLQLDGLFAPKGYDEQSPIDFEGDFLIATRTLELMAGSDVRVLIPIETDPRVAIRQLKKMVTMLETRPELRDLAKPDEKDTQAFEDQDCLPF
jgi:hypothetical protein